MNFSHYRPRMLRLTGRTNDRDVLVNTRPDVFLHIFANIWWIRFPLRYDMDMIGFNMPLSLKLEIEQGTLVNFKLQLYKSNTLTLIITIYSISPINIYDFCLVNDMNIMHFPQAFSYMWYIKKMTTEDVKLLEGLEIWLLLLLVHQLLWLQECSIRKNI